MPQKTSKRAASQSHATIPGSQSSSDNENEEPKLYKCTCSKYCGILGKDVPQSTFSRHQRIEQGLEPPKSKKRRKQPPKPVAISTRQEPVSNPEDSSSGRIDDEDNNTPLDNGDADSQGEYESPRPHSDPPASPPTNPTDEDDSDKEEEPPLDQPDNPSPEEVEASFNEFKITNKFIDKLRNASLDDETEKLDTGLIERLRNPPRDSCARTVRECEEEAIRDYIESEFGQDIADGWYGSVVRWARIQLPTGQIARSSWNEGEESRFSRHVKLKVESEGVVTAFAEILFYFILSFDEEERYVALASFFSEPNPYLLQLSHKTYWSFQHLRDTKIRVVEIKDITDVVIMAPDHQYATRYSDGSEIDRWHMVQKPGRKLACPPLETIEKHIQDVVLACNTRTGSSSSHLDLDYDLMNHERMSSTQQYLDLPVDYNSPKAQHYYSQQDHVPMDSRRVNHISSPARHALTFVMSQLLQQRPMNLDSPVTFNSDELRALRDEVLVLRAENNVLKSTNASLLSLLQTGPSMPSMSMSMSSAQPAPSLPSLQQAQYRDVKYWQQGQWAQAIKKQKGRSTGNTISRNSLLFIEDKHGNSPSEEKVKEYRNFCYQFFFSLLQAGNAPTTWGKATHEVVSQFRSSAEREFSELRLCEGHWKAARLAGVVYFSWTSTHLSKDANVKTEENDDNDNALDCDYDSGDDIIPARAQSAHPSRPNKRSNTRVSSQGPQKKSKSVAPEVASNPHASTKRNKTKNPLFGKTPAPVQVKVPSPPPTTAQTPAMPPFSSIAPSTDAAGEPGAASDSDSHLIEDHIADQDTAAPNTDPASPSPATSTISSTSASTTPAFVAAPTTVVPAPVVVPTIIAPATAAYPVTAVASATITSHDNVVSPGTNMSSPTTAAPLAPLAPLVSPVFRIPTSVTLAPSIAIPLPVRPLAAPKVIPTPVLPPSASFQTPAHAPPSTANSKPTLKKKWNPDKNSMTPRGLCAIDYRAQNPAVDGAIFDSYWKGLSDAEKQPWKTRSENAKAALKAAQTQSHGVDLNNKPDYQHTYSETPQATHEMVKRIGGGQELCEGGARAMVRGKVAGEDGKRVRRMGEGRQNKKNTDTKTHFCYVQHRRVSSCLERHREFPGANSDSRGDLWIVFKAQGQARLEAWQLLKGLISLYTWSKSTPHIPTHPESSLHLGRPRRLASYYTPSEKEPRRRLIQLSYSFPSSESPSRDHMRLNPSH
ncbi:hypothetical protein R3P38DRAFT_2810923 [Favolaschia claudopus]|uniref:Uncharacterized protein n=1 Tax=Favolaschia claudopus TaxID=2862362 RepID=A0AAV9ZAR6_9AGAR